jgi:hypothetical protein
VRKRMVVELRPASVIIQIAAPLRSV